jgi:hypothetical protein
MSQQFVSVPVPAERVSEVYKLLATPAGGSSLPTTTEASTEDWGWIAQHSYTKNDWPIDTIRRAVVESNAGQRQFFRQLADHQGEWLTTQEIATALQVERKNISGALSGLSRRAKHRYKLPVWFFDAQWDGSQYHYRMHEREAVAILDALAG